MSFVYNNIYYLRKSESKSNTNLENLLFFREVYNKRESVVYILLKKIVFVLILNV